ncbi:MAG: CARDB domain-containing protein [Halapricum sp.]
MYVYTESPSGEVEEHKFWGDSDLNTPRGRQDQIAGADYLSHTINVSAGSNLSVFGSSHYCDGWQDSGIDRTVDGYSGEFDAYRCGDRGGERITIDSSQNPSNLVILGDGEEVPSWGAAEDDQRSVGDILQDKMHDNGTLNLEPDQRVLLYELSEANADPDDATPGVSGDPDYNDAVVLFEVVNRTQTIDVKAPARFEITDVSAPAQVDEGSTAELDVTVENAGEATNDTDINYYFDGSTSGSQHVNLTGGESTTITFDVPPSASASTGTHSYTVEVDRNPDERRSGSIYVGSASEAKFIVQGYEESYPRTVKQGDAASVSVTIANIGDADGTQNVEIDWDGFSDPDETKVVSIDSDESRELAYDIPTDDLGTFDFTVSTENDSSTRTVHVRNDAFVVNRVLVGPEEYSEGDTIVSTALSNIRGEIENVGAVAGDRDVTFTLTNRSTGDSVSDTESVSLAGGGVDLAEFDLGPWSDAPGYYDYEIDTGDDTFTGTIQIVEAGSVDEPEPDTYISIDMNVITIESDD